MTQEQAREARELVRKIGRRCPCCGGAVVVQITGVAELEAFAERFLREVASGRLVYAIVPAEEVEEALRASASFEATEGEAQTVVRVDQKP